MTSSMTALERICFLVTVDELLSQELSKLTMNSSTFLQTAASPAILGNDRLKYKLNFDLNRNPAKVKGPTGVDWFNDPVPHPRGTNS